MNALRPILVLGVILTTCFLSMRYSEHHSGTNDDAFNLLYKHVEPALLVSHGDDHGAEAADHSGDGHHAATPLIAIPLPLPAAFDGDHAHDGTQLVMTNLQLFQIAAAILVLIAFSGIPGYLRTGQGDVISRVLAGFCLWIRDEMVYPVMGKEEGRKYLPFFLSIFFFILFMNVMGLVPGSATATANIFVTAALASITLFSIIGVGMVVQGPGRFWLNLVPHVPLALWPLMFVIEFMGLLIKPFSLTVRLFANMMGGHLVVLSFMGLIFFFAGVEKSAMGWAVSPFAVGFGVFIMIIEAFVAMLQAYIFTQLSIIFVGSAVHPEH